jgi:hypothetical protein
MNTLAASAQTAGATGWPSLVIVLMVGATVLVLGLARLLRRTLAVLTRLLVSAGAAMTGLATSIAVMAVLSTVLAVYLR